MRSQHLLALPAVAFAAVALAAARPAAAQIPWVLFEDAQSDSVCDLVNAENVELVVLSATGELVIVTDEDVILGDTFVDDEGQVFFQNVLVGFIEFAEDGDGFRTLWVTSLTGRVMIVNETTGRLTSGTFFPEDFINVPCDACPLWDFPGDCECFADADCDDGDDCTDDICDPALGCVSAEVDCEDGDPCTDDGCVGGTCVSIEVDGPCDDGDACTVDDECIAGVCDGIPVFCDDDDPCTDDLCDPDEGCLFVEVLCDDDNPCTDDVCTGEVCVFIDNDDPCNDGDPCTEDDFCERGECGGFVIEDCNGDGPSRPPINISFCGAGAGLAMIFAFLGLCGMRTRRAGGSPADHKNLKR